MPRSLPLVPRDLPGKIDSLPCDELARRAGFVRRDRGKITAAGFLKTACLFGLGSSASLSAFAQLWSLPNDDTLSKQAVAKRCSSSALAFLESVLQSVIASFLDPSSRPNPLPSGFRRILVQDSTNLSLARRVPAHPRGRRVFPRSLALWAAARAAGEFGPLDLLDLLRGHDRWDGWVHVGKARLPVRVLAERLDEHIAAERRRKARADRDKRLAHNPEYHELLGWNIFITNVPEAMAGIEVLVQLYALRWRIEIVFKAWKSHFRLEQFTDGSARQILVVVLGKLIWICWFTAHFNALVAEGLKVSILKLAQWWSENARQVFGPEPPDPDTILRSIRYYCRYERRRDRRNYLEKLEAALG